MIYLPKKAWDARKYPKDGGYLFLFKDEKDAWHQLQIFSDGRPPILHHFDIAPDLETFGDFLPEAAVEVRAEEYRIIWFDDGKIAVTRPLSESGLER
jgi:hypothetical protein